MTTHLTKNMANLFLQMSLYFNSHFSPLWFFIQIGCLLYKFYALTQLYKFLLITALLVITPLEVIRLYLGYIGNLSNKVPELAGFWLLTLFLQCPLQSWLTFSSGAKHFDAERIMNYIMIFFIAIEVLTGYIALKTVSKEQAQKFKMQTPVEHFEQSETAVE